MRFALALKLTSDEANKMGTPEALSLYLAELSAKFASGNTARDGVVFDGNGGNIGTWKITGR